MSFAKLYVAFVFVSVAVALLFVKFFANALILDWFIYTLLSASLLLPLLGFAFGFSSIKFAYIGILLYIFGFLGGLIYYKYIWLYFVVDSQKHLYLSMPIASLCVGLLLILPENLRKWLILFVGFILGMMVAVTINLTDPTIHDAIIPKIALSVSVWIIFLAMFGVRIFYRNWFNIPIRIFASWLIASGLLYGGVALATKNGTIKTSPTIKKEQNLDTNLVPDFG